MEIRETVATNFRTATIRPIFVIEKNFDDDLDWLNLHFIYYISIYNIYIFECHVDN